MPCKLWKLILFLLLFENQGSLAENNRLKLIPNVVRAFGKLMSATRGEVLCTVTTAKVCKCYYFCWVSCASLWGCCQDADTFVRNPKKLRSHIKKPTTQWTKQGLEIHIIVSQFLRFQEPWFPETRFTTSTRECGRAKSNLWLLHLSSLSCGCSGVQGQRNSTVTVLFLQSRQPQCLLTVTTVTTLQPRNDRNVSFDKFRL